LRGGAVFGFGGARMRYAAFAAVLKSFRTSGAGFFDKVCHRIFLFISSDFLSPLIKHNHYTVLTLFDLHGGGAPSLRNFRGIRGAFLWHFRFFVAGSLGDTTFSRTRSGLHAVEKLRVWALRQRIDA
jgi:hypothetical protein